MPRSPSHIDEALPRRIAPALLASSMLLGTCGLAAQDASGPGPAGAVRPPADDLIELPELVVESDALELEDGEESRLWSVRAPPGSLFAEMLGEQAAAREEFGGLDDLVGDLGQLEPPSLGSGSGATAPRGFTTPRLRNGFTQQGFPEVVTQAKREVISGMLATFFGRTAPGGIVNSIPFPPAARPQERLEVNATTHPRLQVRANATGPLVPKRVQFRVQADASGREGPVDFQRETAVAAGVTIRRRKGPWTTTWDLEALGRAGVPGNGIPQERASSSAPVGAPYLPLAGLSLQGPDTSFARLSASTSLVLERKFGDALLLRSGTQLWGRDAEELRFRHGQFVPATGTFSGIREPQWTASSEAALSQAIEAVVVHEGEHVQHRFLAGVEGSVARRDRLQRQLPTAARDALPVAVRVFDPFAPDYAIVPYDPATYSRVVTDRDDATNYAGGYVSERVSWAEGRNHATVGLRWDRVDTVVDDLRPSAPVPHAERSVDRVTHHAGILSEVVRGQLALFANTSTAFQPNERIDTRTGLIQGNESTAGVEGGFRAQTRDKRWATTLGVYRLWNEDITRLNPLFEDPVADPDGRQPQLLSSGEERFTGAELTARWIPVSELSVTAKLTWTDAVTTASPDLPEETGRQLAGLPEWFGGLVVRQNIPFGERKTLGWRLHWNVVGEHVARYASDARLEVAYPAFATVDLGVDAGWGDKLRQRVSLFLRNAGDRDLAALTGRLDGQRRLEASWSAVF